MIPVRNEGPNASVPEVRRALDILQILRHGNDADAQLASYKARRELAIIEQRDPELIAALEKMIDGLTNSPAEVTPEGGKAAASTQLLSDRLRVRAQKNLNNVRARLSDREQLLMDSDTSSMDYNLENILLDFESPKNTLECQLLAELVESVEARRLGQQCDRAGGPGSVQVC